MKGILAAFAIVVALGTTTAEDKKDDKKIDAAKLVGKWEVTKAAEGGAPKGTIVELTKDGKLIVMAEISGEKKEYKGTYKVDGDKLKTEIEIEGTTQKDEDTIKTLTDDKLVIVDKDGKENELTKKK